MTAAPGGGVPAGSGPWSGAEPPTLMSWSGEPRSGRGPSGGMKAQSSRARPNRPPLPPVGDVQRLKYEYLDVHGWFQGQFALSRV